jgi:hypothetical protein
LIIILGCDHLIWKSFVQTPNYRDLLRMVM